MVITDVGHVVMCGCGVVMMRLCGAYGGCNLPIEAVVGYARWQLLGRCVCLRIPMQLFPVAAGLHGHTSIF